MKFLFDNNLSIHLAKAIACLCAGESDVEEVVHLRERFNAAVPDVEWIQTLQETGHWSIVSIDKFKKSAGAEREVLRRAGFTVYVLDPQWSKQPFWLQSARLVEWWPHVLQHARLTSSGVFRVQWRPTGGHRFAAC